MTSKTIQFLPAGKICQVRDEESILEVALRNGIELPHSCGGMGSCTTCRIFIEHAPMNLPRRNELELDIASMREFADHERLACQLPPLNGLVVRIPEPT